MSMTDFEYKFYSNQLSIFSKIVYVEFNYELIRISPR